MQALDRFAKLTIIVIYLAFIFLITYADGLIQIGRWNYGSKTPSLQLSRTRKNHSNVVSFIVYFSWLLVFLAFLRDPVILLLGFIPLVLVYALGLTLGLKGFQDVPLDVLVYNYKVNSEWKHKSTKRFTTILLNKKQDRRHDY
ncbi:MAG: hypothetical protein KGD60_12050 [Candidatus Thorarchaeota archaeon]|nr:hypothetical protein [Candidatus Thorarchaeota archaeon]